MNKKKSDKIKKDGQPAEPKLAIVQPAEHDKVDMLEKVVRELVDIYRRTDSVRAFIIAFLCGHRKLYTYLGYQTEEEFRIGFSDYGRTQFIKIKNCGEALLNSLPFDLIELLENQQSINSQNLNNTIGKITQSQAFEEIAKVFNSLGIEKVNHYLKKGDDPSLKELAKTGIVRLENGEEYSLEDFIDMSKREVLALSTPLTYELKSKNEQIASQKQEFSKEKANLKERAMNAEAERDHYASQLKSYERFQSDILPTTKDSQKFQAFRNILVETHILKGRKKEKINVPVNIVDFLTTLKHRLNNEFDEKEKHWSKYHLDVQSQVFSVSDIILEIAGIIRYKYKDLVERESEFKKSSLGDNKAWFENEIKEQHEKKQIEERKNGNSPQYSDDALGGDQ